MVADFEKWKPAFYATAVSHRKRFYVFAVEGNRDDLLVMEEFDTPEHADAWVDSADHREAMARAGVSAPALSYLSTRPAQAKWEPHDQRGQPN